jgi:hypothetical protein
MTSIGTAAVAYTVNEYCGREKISRARLYKEWKEGRGPKFYHRGARRLISVEAADEYRRQLEAEAARA